MWLVAALSFSGAAAFAVAGRGRHEVPVAVPVPAPAEPPAAPLARTSSPLPPAAPLPPPIVAPPAVVAPPIPTPDTVAETNRENEAYVAAARARRDAEQREAARSRARSSVRVVMYSTSWCGYCKRARAWLAGSGVGYVDLDVERDESARARFHTINPGGGVPTFEVDDQVLRGFSPGQLDAALALAVERRAR